MGQDRLITRRCTLEHGDLKLADLGADNAHVSRMTRHKERFGMKLEGSCDCGRIRFNVRSSAPDPYRVCYCRRCRKTAGGVGAAINILADADSLMVEGELDPKAYAASPGLTVRFCPECASALFIELAGWPQWVYPFASAIDSTLPLPPNRVHIQWAERVAWSPILPADGDAVFERDTPESILEWHERMGRVQAE